ncbi:type II secretion system F family protein [Lichenicoccus roseus]|uniref:Secretion system protein n=1 Tax=Lichenicoccus roseus TaxID=2683649 RepID=A0A5R9J514_9PROT|nr:type II secretion system F family protein [Lichenicoccus roseus]TLU72715.1 secretion system protein [Lichenicoccus roseus]
MNRVALLSLATACAGAIAVCGAALLLNESHVARLAITRRMTSIITPYRVNEVSADPSSVRTAGSGSDAAIRLEVLFGFRRVRRMQYTQGFLRVLVFSGCPAAIAGWLALHVAGMIALPVAPVLWVVLSRLFYRHCDRRRSAALFRQFPDALGMIVRAVRVGVPLGRSIILISKEAPDPTSAEFRQLAEEMAVGVPLAEALRAMGARNQLAEYRFFATALSLQNQTGGGLAETLETLADTVRKRVAARMRGYALASEARASCYVLGGLPFVVGVLLFFSNPSYMMPLFTTSFGLKLVATAAASLTIGLTLMQQITNRSLA